MPRLARVVPPRLAGILSALVAAASAAPLLDLGDQTLAGQVRLADAKVSVMMADGVPALRVAFGSGIPYPSIRFESGRLGFSGDWSKASALAVTVVNPGPEPFPLGLRIDSRAAPDRGRQGTAAIPPGREVRLVLPVSKGGAIPGMIGQPPLAHARPGDMNLTPSPAPFDPSGVTSFQLFVPQPAGQHTLLLKHVELLTGSGPVVPFVDRFGQFRGAEWPGKLIDEGEFARRREAEAAALAQLGALPDRDPYGGWAGGPKLEATGRFRVQKYAGKWWFVDPEGRLFWSSGITGLRPNNATRVADRENFFAWLPGPRDPLAGFFAGRGPGRTFDFYRANLFRKYGADFEAAFLDRGVRRLMGWGVNTIANWSDERSWSLRRVPYTVPIHTGVASFVVTERLKAGKPWVRRFPDPFAPEFTAVLDERLGALASLQGDPWLLGVFIDNELPWAEGSPARSVAAAALDLPGSAPVKSALLRQLQAAYPAVAALNAAFGTRFASWAEAAGPWKLGAAQLKSAAAPLAALDAAVAEQYFRAGRDALRRHLPGTLYLGCRFHVYNREAIRAAKAYCDVVSFNVYGYLPSERQADEFATEMDFPVVIGEFHFGATDRGMFHPGLRQAGSQADRADKYVAYLREAAAAPWCIGAHWFQYLDQPLTGRGDGENYNIGFVNATDDPYPELTDAARRFHATLYPARLTDGGR